MINVFGRDDLTFVVDQIAVNGTCFELDGVTLTNDDLFCIFYTKYLFKVLCLFVRIFALRPR